MKFFLLYPLLFIISLNSFASTYYVAPSGSGGDDNNAGTLAAPFETIAYALTQLSAGDTLYLREGTYRETITITQDGSSGNVITIEAYTDNGTLETVTIDGTVDISGTWSTYSGVSGAYQLSSYSTDITQLFVDDVPMVNARWPNAQFNDDSIFSWDTWAQGDEDNSSNGSLTIDEDEHDPTGLDLNGSIGILNIGSFRTWAVAMTGHTQNGSSDDVITYSTGDIGTYKTKHHYYFFEGKLELLDTNNEWFHDKSNDILYLFPDDGLDPSSRTIKAKTTDYRVTFNNANYITFKKINFFATTIDFINSEYLSIEECNFYYPTASERMLGTTNGVGTLNVLEIDANSHYNTIKKCLFENAEGEAFRIKGTNNTIENNYFHHIDWSVSDLEGLMTTIYSGSNAEANTFTKNTIHTTGASATVLPGINSEFSYNKVTNTGLLQSDGAVFQGTTKFVEGSNVHHNFVYDTEKYAYRYDAAANDPSGAGNYGVMHHNIADNTNGLMAKGNNQIIAHNTILNTKNGKNDIVILSEACSNTNTWLYNNLAERIGSHRSSQSFSLTSKSPMPIAGNIGLSDVGYLKESSTWRACEDTDAYYVGTGNGSSQENIDEIDVSPVRTGITYNSDVEALIAYDSSDGKSEADYVPTNNATLVDQGISPTTTVNTSTTTTDALNNLVPHTNVSSAADIGALEYGGTVWTAGIDWTPKFHTAIWKTTASTTVWNTATNWSTGAVPTTDVNVLIPTGASNYPVISSTGAAAKNITVNTSATLTINRDSDLTLSGNLVNRGTITLNSDADEFASIIVQGTSSGNIIYKRYVADEGSDEWDLIGSPVAGQSISSFVSANSSIADEGSQYGIGVFSNDGSTDTAAAMYTNYTTGNVGDAGNFTAGQGYAMATDEADTPGTTLDFTGTIRTTDLTGVAIDDNSSNATNFGKWNLVANPFPSYLNANSDAHASNNFLTVNSSNLHTSYAAVYGYDGDGSFTVYNHTSPGSAVYIAPGQGFFVASDDSGGNTIQFTEAMQTVSGTDDFNDENSDILDDIYHVLLRLYEGEYLIEETALYFQDGLNLGLDPGYDAGAFNQNAALMTRLVEEDEGHGMAINAMSTEDMDDVVIPLEINQSSGQEFRVNLHTSSIGQVNIYLEDTELQTLTLLNEEDFVLTPTSDLSNMGRFYLHLTADTLSDEEVNTSLLNAYKKVDNNYITIEGLATQPTSTEVSLYNILGTKLMDTILENTINIQMISTNGLFTGIYVIKLISGKDQLTKKLIIH